MAGSAASGSRGSFSPPDAGTTPVGDRLAPALGPVRAGSGFEEALERLLRALRLGLAAPGERLPAERELAGRLGVSRATLREVLEVLRAEGLVESRRGRYGGTFVRAAPPPGSGREALRRRTAGVDVEDALRLREVLDVGAVTLCARQGLDDDGARRLREALAATGEAPPESYRRADTHFHLALAGLCGSTSLAGHYADVRATLNGLLDCIPLLVRNLEHSQRQHAEVVSAVLAGDTEAAAATMREHCAGTAALLRGFLG
ncbi:MULTISPECIES: FadR/GntR family transcriptional regulator [unclassified Streptomyces]|uniref:FadR/GntR family transcriptional regulator n=1 Tax=unclassified Streptomyces TaxID=2593676 RepID=UPI000CD50598|nr:MULTISPECIES: FCD domain-containing protein [unclassified Streptomyces]